jgi:hypothetical protein
MFGPIEHFVCCSHEKATIFPQRGQSCYLGLTLLPMSDRAYLIRFKETTFPPDLVIAVNVEFHGEHLIFLRSDGSLAALFTLEIVDSWSEFKLCNV